MTGTYPELDQHRQALLDAGAATTLAWEVAKATPEYAAMRKAQDDFERTPQNARHTAELERYDDLAAEGPGHHTTCELCGCILFSDDKVDEICSDPESGVSVCMAAGYEDETKDCPGKRLGLIGDATPPKGDDA